MPSVMAMLLAMVIGPGIIDGGGTSLTIAAGSVESQLFTVTRAEGAGAVAIDIGDLPGLPARHRGYALVKSADLPLTVSAGGRLDPAGTMFLGGGRRTRGD